MINRWICSGTVRYDNWMGS